MANQNKKLNKRRGKSDGALAPFVPARGGFTPNAGLTPQRNSGGCRGKNTPANWRRFNP